MYDLDNKKKIPTVNDSRVLTYLNLRNKTSYANTAAEEELMNLWRMKYYIAKDEYEASRVNSANVSLWREAYEGQLFELDKFGKKTTNKMKALHKMAYELVEGKVNSTIPSPKMSPRYHSDITSVNATESLMAHELDRMWSEQTNDELEHGALIDGSVWIKVSWNPFDNTHERSGTPLVEACPVDTVFPQPGVKNWRLLEYIFESTTITVAQALDLYGREIPSPTQNDIIPIVNCYYLNANRYVGKFTWCDDNGLVLCNDVEWGIRKRRRCKKCHKVVAVEDECPLCGSTSFEYVPVEEETLEEDLVYITNPYKTGATNDPSQNYDRKDENKSIPAGTVLPHYLVRQLPFVPYRRVSVPGSIYGISEVEVVLENQDYVNKFLNKAQRKSASSKTYITKLKDTRIQDKNEELSYIEVETAAEGQAMQAKHVQGDISQEMAMVSSMYEISKSNVGVTNTDQGKNDSTAVSGKAKQLQMAASNKRNYGPTALRNASYAGVYELIFKNLLAYSDEARAFVSLLPDGTQMEQQWSKYMFLAQDDFGEYYYRDDFAWSVDSAAEITQDRAAMWQLIDTDFLNGTMGTSIDPTRAMMMYWNMKKQFGYPTAKYAVAFLEDAVNHLPTQIEQALVSNPEAVQLALSFIQDQQKMAGQGPGPGSGPGGARDGAGQKGNGLGHAANVEKTNNKNRGASGNSDTNTDATKSGGMQGGTTNIEGGKE